MAPPRAGRRRPLACAVGRGALLAGVVAAIETRRPHLLLPVCQLALALSGLQLSWLCFRVRARLLLALQTDLDGPEEPAGSGSAVSPAGSESPSTASMHRARYRCALQAAVSPSGFAVQWLADKSAATRGNAVPVALAVSLLAGAAAVAVVVVCLPLVATFPAFHTAWWLVVGAGGVGVFSGSLTACLAPTGADAMLLGVLQGCFTFSRMNTVVAHHQNSQKNDPEIIDDLYLTLTGCCILIAWRVISSADVMHTLFAALLDTFVLVYLLATMMEIADFVDHPNANEFPLHFSTFFLAVSAGQVASWAVGVLSSSGDASSTAWRSRASRRRAAVQCGAFELLVGGAVASAAAACLATVAAYVCLPHLHPFKSGLLIMMPLAAVIAQLGGAVLGLFKETALAPRRAPLSIWNNGALDTLNPFLLAWIVVHPYSKHLLSSAASSDGSGGSYGG